MRESRNLWHKWTFCLFCNAHTRTWKKIRLYSQNINDCSYVQLAKVVVRIWKYTRHVGQIMFFSHKCNLCLFHRADLFNVEQIQHLLDYKPPWRELLLQQRKNLSTKVGSILILFFFIVTEVYSSVSFSYEILSPCRSQGRQEENHHLSQWPKKKGRCNLLFVLV